MTLRELIRRADFIKNEYKCLSNDLLDLEVVSWDKELRRVCRIDAVWIVKEIKDEGD